MPRNEQKATARVVAETDGLDADLRQAATAFDRFGSKVRKSVDEAFTVDPGRVAKGVGAGLAGAAALTAAKVGEMMEFKEALTSLQIQAGFTGEEMGILEERIRSTWLATGEGKDELLAGLQGLVDLMGAGAANADMLELMANSMLATKAPAKDLAGVIFALSNAFKFGDDPRLMEEALSSVIAAGKDGSVPLNDMASALRKTAASFAEVSAAGREGATDLAVAMQIGVRGAFGGADEVATGLQASITALISKSKEFERAGVKVFTVEDGVEKMRPLLDIFDDIAASKLAASKTKLVGAFGTVEALKFFDAITKNRQAFIELRETALQSSAVSVDAQKRLNSEAQQYKIQLANLQNETDKAFSKEAVEGYMEAVKGATVATALLFEGTNKLKNLIVDLATDSDEESHKAIARDDLNDIADRIRTGPKRADIRDRARKLAAGAREQAIDDIRAGVDVEFPTASDEQKKAIVAKRTREFAPIQEFGPGRFVDKAREDLVNRELREFRRVGERSGLIGDDGRFTENPRDIALAKTRGKGLEANTIAVERLAEALERSLAAPPVVQVHVDQESKLQADSQGERNQ